MDMIVSIFNKNKLSVALLVVCLFWSVTIDAQTEPQFSVNITDPARDGIEVGKEMDVRGTAFIPSGNHLWLLIHRTKGFGKVWWPQGEAEIDPKTHNWELHVTFGMPRDIGYEFRVTVITVNEQEHQRLEAYWYKATESGDWKPLRMPPTTSAPKFRIVKKVNHN